MRARMLIVSVLAGAVLLAGGYLAATAASGGDRSATGDAFALPCTDGAPAAPAPATVKARVGGTFTIRLCTNPSTGYAWGDPVVAPASMVALTDRATEVASPALPGASSTDVITFRASAAGTATVTFAYGQPWPGGSKDAVRVTLTIVVS